MATWTPQRNDTLEALVAEIRHNYPEGRVIVAVDGVDGAGKTYFADSLAAEMGRGSNAVFRASMDDFHRPRADRYARGRDSAEGFYSDSYDYRTFRRILTDPFRIGRIGSFVLQAFDLERNMPIEPKWTTAPDDAVLIVDGIFLNRPELKGIWNYSIWLDVDPEVAAERMVVRDGPPRNPTTRYTGGQELYLEEAKPRETANAIIDNTDFEHPRRVFADSC
jgi:uridine kinase